MSMVIAMTLLSAVVLLPLIWRVIAIRRPLKVATGGASFESPFRRWKLTHVTGTVLASSTVPVTYGSGGVYGGSASGNVTGTVRIYTDVHETMRKFHVPPRAAAYILAVGRVADLLDRWE